jgi:hypothetical protein
VQANTADPGFLRKGKSENQLKTIVELAEVMMQFLSSQPLDIFSIVHAF